MVFSTGFLVDVWVGECLRFGEGVWDAGRCDVSSLVRVND